MFRLFIQSFALEFLPFLAQDIFFFFVSQSCKYAKQQQTDNDNKEVYVEVLNHQLLDEQVVHLLIHVAQQVKLCQQNYAVVATC